MKRARVGIAGGLLCLFVLAGAAHAESGSDPVESAVTTEQIAAALRADPIFIQQQSAGGDKAGARKLVRTLIDDLPYPVYVVAGAVPLDGASRPAQTFAYALRRELGTDGVFVIAPVRGGVAEVVPLGAGLPRRASSNDVPRVMRATLKLFPDDFRDVGGQDWSRVRLTALAEALIDLQGLGGATMTAAQVNALAQKPFLHVVTREYPDPHRSSSVAGKRWMVGSLVAGLIAVWLPVAVRALLWGRRREGPARREVGSASSAQREQLWEQRRTELSRLVAAHDPGDSRRPELWAQAHLAKEAADTFADSADEADRLGASTLVERGLHAARLAGTTHEYRPWRPCFLNPTHGQAGPVRQWVFDDAEIRVPLCEACARALDRAEPPQPLLVKRGWRRVPYFEVDNLWGRTGYGALIDDYAETVLREGAKR